MKFFDNSQSLSWSSWLKRRIWPSSNKPIPFSIVPTPIKISSLGLLASPATKNNAKEYTNFLTKYFSKNVQTYIDHRLFEAYLTNGLIGAELRDKKGDLIGTVFSWYCGILENTQVGLITWLCVRPDMRKKGLANYLLYTIQTLTYPRTIHFFRNDGWLKSPLPPLWTDIRMYRKRVHRMTTAIHKVSLESCRSKIYDSWKKTNPTGFILDDQTSTNSLIEVWEYKKSGVFLLIQPTFETEMLTNYTWCEVLYWICDTSYTASMCIEAIIDALPYDYIEASTKLPHIYDWSIGGQSSWCVHGLDPGNPVVRPVLSLLAN
jgi:hypothetical protein